MYKNIYNKILLNFSYPQINEYQVQDICCIGMVWDQHSKKQKKKSEETTTTKNQQKENRIIHTEKRETNESDKNKIDFHIGSTHDGGIKTEKRSI